MSGREENLRELERELDRIGLESREILDEIARPERRDAFGEELVRRTILAEAGVQPGRRSIRRRGWLALVSLSAAAAVLLVIWFGNTPPETPGFTGPQDQLLDGTAPILVPKTPVGPVERYGEFEWSPHPDAEFYEVIVHDAAGAIVAESGPLTEPRWTPPPTDRWPREIRWELHAATTAGSTVVRTSEARIQE